MLRVRTRAQDPADVVAAQHRQIEVENHEVGRPVGDGVERGVSGADHLGLRLAAAFERVLDETGDVLLVLDDEYTMLGHDVVLNVAQEVSPALVRLCCQSPTRKARIDWAFRVSPRKQMANR